MSSGKHFGFARGRRAKTGACLRITRLAALGAAAIAMLLVVKPTAQADSAQEAARDLSDRAFSMLNSINANPTQAGALLGPVANLASDAQTLTAALGRGDNTNAGHAMAAVEKDRGEVDALLRKGSRAPDPAQWKSIGDQITALSRRVHPDAGSIATDAPPASGPSTAAALPPEAPGTPRVVVESRAFSDGYVRVRGYLEGTDLKSAGIFDGDQQVKPLDIGHVSGQERVRFDLSIEAPTASEAIQVTDGLERIARAPVAPDVAALPNTRRGGEKVIELGGGAGGDSVASADSGAAPMPEPRNNTAEIPRADSPDRSEGSAGRRFPGGAGGNLANVQINVIAAEPMMDQPGSYQVVGQISGAGVRRAGIYVEGRLVKPIPLGAGSYNSFDVTFPLLAGKEATIRAYGVGGNFVEASVDTSDNGMTTMGEPPNPYGVPNPYGAPNPYAYGNPYAVRPNPYGYGYPPPYRYPAPATPAPWYRRLFP